MDDGGAQTLVEIHVRQYCESAKPYVNCDTVQKWNVVSSYRLMSR